MKKILISSILILFIAIYLIYNSLSTSLYDVMNNEIEMNDVKEIEAEVDFTVLSSKKFRIDKISDRDQLINLFKTIKIRPVDIDVISGHPKLILAYNLYFYDHNNRVLSFIRINYKDYILFDKGQYYKITNQSPFEEIYKIIILSQNINDVDDFYFEIITE